MVGKRVDKGAEMREKKREEEFEERTEGGISPWAAAEESRKRERESGGITCKPRSRDVMVRLPYLHFCSRNRLYYYSPGTPSLTPCLGLGCVLGAPALDLGGSTL